MLQLYDLQHKKIHGLVNYKDIKLERELSNGDERLSFSYPLNDKFYKDIVEESYIRTKENEYIIKEIHELDNWTEFNCNLNIEDLEGKAWDGFESIEQSIVDALNLALVGTGWTVGHNNVSKKRTVRKTNCSSWDIVQDIKKTYMVDMKFDCINKQINVYEHLGSDKGVYFMDSLNIVKLETQRDSYDFYTRLIPIGKDGLSITDINNGKEYVENYQYSNKVKTILWKDERYTDKESLKADGKAKLNDLSKPRRAYKVDINNLAKTSKNKYSILDYNLGDTITLISKDKHIKEKQRIVKITEYPKDHSKDTIEIANTILSFEEVQQALQDAVGTVDNITNDNGTVNGKCVDGLESNQISDFKEGVNKVVNFNAVNANIQHLKAFKADIQDLNVVREKVGTLEATTINTTQFHALKGQIDIFKSTMATISDLNVVNEKVKIIEGDTANLKTIINGNLTSKNFQSLNLTSDKVTVENGFIKDEMVDSLTANKINTGTLETDKVDIKSSDGNLSIKDNTIQIKDNKIIRVQIGKDASNNYGIYVWDIIGNLMFSSDLGLMDHGIKNKIIRNDMVSDNANIQGHKLDIDSIVREVNNHSSTIKASKINIDTENQTLDMAFSKLKATTTKTKDSIESALTKLDVHQGQIKAVLENSKIIENKQLTLEDNYNRVTNNIDSLKTEIGTHTSIFDSIDNKIVGVEVKTNTLEKGLSNMVQSLHETKESFEKDKEIIDSKTSTLEQSLDHIKDELSSTKKSTENNIEDLKNKTISVENNLDGITNKVSSVEIKTNELNKDVIKQINEFTSYKQSNNEFQLEINKSLGKYNLLWNGNLTKKNKRGWFIDGKGSWFDDGYTLGFKNDDWNKTVFLYSNGVDTSNIKNISISTMLNVESNVQKCQVYLIGSKDSNFKYDWYTELANDIPKERKLHTFENMTIPDNIKTVWLRIDHVNSLSNTYCCVYIEYVNVVAGKYAYTDGWLPARDELVGSTISIRGDEIIANYSNGAYSIMSKDGFVHWHNGMARPYHFINHYVVRPQVRNGSWETIVLPEEFQDKELNRDFIVICQHGDIDSNVGARFQQDAIRNIFIKVISWTSSNRQLVIQPCMQKIGVRTATHWGWDSGSTTPGKTAGEGAIDLIILAQM